MSDETKFTPGRWEVSGAPDDYAFSIVGQELPQGGRPIIADVCQRGQPGMTEANARLIAAAPELYADLAVLVKAFGSTSDHGLWVRARETLARTAEVE